MSDELSPNLEGKGNHELLQNIFKIVRMCAEGFDYEPSYYYTRQEETGQFPEYSNLLITENSVILFTNDLRESILFSAPDQVASFREKYHRLADGKPTLFYIYRDIESLMDNMNRVLIDRRIKVDETEYYYVSLPCVLPFLTKEIMENHLFPEGITRPQDEVDDTLKKIFDYVEVVRIIYISQV